MLTYSSREAGLLSSVEYCQQCCHGNRHWFAVNLGSGYVHRKVDRLPNNSRLRTGNGHANGALGYFNFVSL